MVMSLVRGQALNLQTPNEKNRGDLSEFVSFTMF